MVRAAGAGGQGGPASPPGGEGTLRDHALEVFGAAVEAAEPGRAVRSHVRAAGDHLEVRAPGGAVRLPLPVQGRVLVVGAGKGSAPMAAALEEILGERISAGLVCVKDGHGVPLERIEVVEAAHPVPDRRGLEAAHRILEMAESAQEGDLVVSVLSGGGSALLTLPAEGVGLEDIRELTQELLRSGATIGEINTLRKHLSRVKGGRLAAAAHPARVLNLVLSDVIGDRLDVIASGPFTADPSTFADAREILERRGLWDRVPGNVRRVILEGLAGRVPETPKPGDPRLEGVVQVIVGSNRKSLDAAAGRARSLGYEPLILTSRLQGEAREVARAIVAMAQESRTTGAPVAPPACLLFGGETTVTLRGDGKGGRNQEMALAMALELRGWDGIVALSGGTDGTDGPTDAAGGVAVPSATARAAALGLDPLEFLARNDSYRLLDALGDLIRTGPTRTNVMDVQVVLVAGGG